MGWSSGTIIFDTVMDDLEKTGLASNTKVGICNSLYKVLTDLDWDNGDESKYWDHKFYGRVLGNEGPMEDDVEWAGSTIQERWGSGVHKESKD